MFAGSCGDLGTFIPLFVALGRERAIYVAPALFWAGFSNVVTGYVWDLPLPVQPMKAIAAVALVGELDRLQVTAAGIWMVRIIHCQFQRKRGFTTLPNRHFLIS